MTGRLSLLALLMLCAAGWTRTMGPREVALPAPLSALPLQLGAWRGIEGPPVAADVARVLRADDYANRVYRRTDGAAVGLWVASYSSQRQGDAIHSPQNCLPGTGWTPLDHSRPVLTVSGRRHPVNRYVVQRRGERQLVVYWYQGRGRIVASEYANKLYLLVDAIRQRRTDGTLVRVTAPVRGDPRHADAHVAEFIAALQPDLSRWLP
jgi:EpsI family protein